MSRLHRQKLRLRAQQRAAGVIDGDEVDSDAFEELGTGGELRKLRVEFAEQQRAEATKAPATGEAEGEGQASAETAPAATAGAPTATNEAGA